LGKLEEDTIVRLINRGLRGVGGCDTQKYLTLKNDELSRYIMLFKV
jgi:hypothetical protein